MWEVRDEEPRKYHRRGRYLKRKEMVSVTRLGGRREMKEKGREKVDSERRWRERKRVG